MGQAPSDEELKKIINNEDIIEVSGIMAEAVTEALDMLPKEKAQFALGMITGALAKYKLDRDL
jgi:hypothetical protein